MRPAGGMEGSQHPPAPAASFLGGKENNRIFPFDSEIQPAPALFFLLRGIVITECLHFAPAVTKNESPAGQLKELL